MDTLKLGIEIRDFDLTRMGFSLSVLDQDGKRQTSEGYLRMSLIELNAFVSALKAADDLSVATVEPSAAAKLPRAAPAPVVESPPEVLVPTPDRRR